MIDEQTKPRVTELVVLIGTVAVAVLSLLWLAIATVRSPAEQVRWELWAWARGGGNVYADEVVATPLAALLSVIVVLVLVGLAVHGYVASPQRKRRRSETALATKVAALTILPLAWTLPAQSTAFRQSGGVGR